MPSPVFYSICPFGTGSIETGSGNISVSSGVATLTVEQTGNIGVGVCVEYNSLKAYIAPNRIGFDSGGTDELVDDTKIEGGTSGATGIVRYVELLSGTWAGGDAVGWIYFEKISGTFQDNEQINRTKPTTSSNIATVNGTIEGNIGNGNTEFVVKTATGQDASNQVSTSVTSIHHEYASFSAFESGFIDANHINNTDLTSADVVPHACQYYDHDDYTADSSDATIDFGSVDSTRHLRIFNPTGESESINKQGHTGKWDANKANLNANLIIQEKYTRFEGTQINGDTRFYAAAPIIKYCIFKQTSSLSAILRLDGNTTDEDIVTNCIVYGDGVTVPRGVFTAGTGNNALLRLYNSTIYNTEEGLDARYFESNIIAKNNAVFNNTDDFVRGENFETCDYNASDDGDGSNAVNWDNGSTDWANVFTDYVNGDFSLNDYTGTGAIIDQGTDLSSIGLWRDIARNERGSSWDIGAFEFVSQSTLLPNKLNQTQALDNVDLIQHHVLDINPINQLQTLDNIILLQANILVIIPIDQSQTIDNPDIIQQNILIINGMNQTQAIDNIDLIQQAIITINDISQIQTLDNISLIQANILVINAIDQAQTLNNIDLQTGIVLQINSVQQAQTIDNISLIQQNNLVISSANQDQTLENVILSADVLLEISDIIQNQNIDSINLLQQNIIDIGSIDQPQDLEHITIEIDIILQIAEIIQNQSVESLNLTQSNILDIDLLLQSQVIDSITFSITEGEITITLILKTTNINLDTKLPSVNIDKIDPPNIDIGIK